MRQDEKTGLKMVTVRRERLRSTLLENLEKHQRDYETATDNYKRKRINLASDLVEAAQAFADDLSEETQVSNAFSALSMQDKPMSYAKEYERAMALAEWEVADEIELSVHDFNCYVLDDWKWQGSFRRSVMSNAG